MLLARERLTLPLGLFLNVITTVLAVCNLFRNRYLLTRALSKEKDLFQEFPLLSLALALSPRTLVAAVLRLVTLALPELQTQSST